MLDRQFYIDNRACLIQVWSFEENLTTENILTTYNNTVRQYEIRVRVDFGHKLGFVKGIATSEIHSEVNLSYEYSSFTQAFTTSSTTSHTAVSTWVVSRRCPDVWLPDVAQPHSTAEKSVL